jgi:hypothetical protein
MIWDNSREAVDWWDGCAYPAGANAGSFDPLSLADIAIRRPAPGVRSLPRSQSTPRALGQPLPLTFAMSRSIRKPDV